METGQVYTRARELWEQLGFPSEFLYIPYGQSRSHLYRGELDLALRSNEDLLRLSRQRNDSAGLIVGHGSSGLGLLAAGKFGSCRSHYEEVLALYDPISHRTLVHQAGIHLSLNENLTCCLGIALFCLGYPDQAAAQSNAAIAEARSLGHAVSLAGPLSADAWRLSLAGDDAAL